MLDYGTLKNEGPNIEYVKICINFNSITFLLNFPF